MHDQILITGATGNVGRPLVRQLVARACPLRLFVRNPKKARDLEGPTVEIARGDLRDRAALERAMIGIDTLFLLSSSSPEQVKLQSNAIRAADRARVRRIVKVSALGTAPHSPVMVARWHAQTEREIRRTGLDYTFLHPHSYMQNLLAHAASIQHDGVLYGAFGPTPLALADARDVADVAAHVLTSSGHDGMTYVVTGPEAITYHEVAQTLSEVLGFTVRYVDLPFEAYQARLTQAGLPAWIASDLTALAALFRTGGDGMQVSLTTEQFLGHPGRSFADFALDYANVFQPTPPSTA